MTETLPEYADACWPVDHSCCDEWDDYDEEVQVRAEALAVGTLRMLTGYRVGGCDITVRPCRRPCVGGGTWRVSPLPGSNGSTGGFTPMSVGGQWINMPCGCNTAECSCGPLCEVALPGPVGHVTEVLVDGVTIDPTAYRLDNHRLLLRTDGDCWPSCQDMTADIDQPNTFAVTYLNGVHVGALGAFAAGQLACEYAKACSGQKCALPTNVTRVVRHGVALDLSTGVFPSNQTGIREVDAWVRRWNPHGLVAPSLVWSPDTPRARHSTG